MQQWISERGDHYIEALAAAIDVEEGLTDKDRAQAKQAVKDNYQEIKDATFDKEFLKQTARMSGNLALFGGLARGTIEFAAKASQTRQDMHAFYQQEEKQAAEAQSKITPTGEAQFTRVDITDSNLQVKYGDTVVAGATVKTKGNTVETVSYTHLTLPTKA